MPDLVTDLARGLGVADVRALVMWVGLALARIVPALYFNPFLGGTSVPAAARMGTGIAFALLMWPMLVDASAVMPGPVEYAALFAKEIIIGFGIGLFATMAFAGFTAAGQIIDMQRGANTAEAMLLQHQQRSSVLGSLLFQMAVVLFLVAGGHLYYLRILAHSYHLIPLDAFPQVTGNALTDAAVVIRQSGQIFAIGMQLAAPAVLLILLVDVGLAFVSRMAPQLDVYFLGLPLKTLVGLGVLLVLLPAMADIMTKYPKGPLDDLLNQIAAWRR